MILIGTCRLSLQSSLLVSKNEICHYSMSIANQKIRAYHSLINIINTPLKSVRTKSNYQQNQQPSSILHYTCKRWNSIQHYNKSNINTLIKNTILKNNGQQQPLSSKYYIGSMTTVIIGLGLKNMWKPLYCERFYQPNPNNNIVSSALTIKESTLMTSMKTEKEKQKKKKTYSLWRDIWDLIKPDILLLLCIVLTAIGAALVHLQTPLITGELINVLTKSVNATTANLSLSMNQLNGPAMKLFALLSLQGLLTFAHITLVSSFGEKVAERLRAKLFSAIVQQDMSFFDSHQSGELVGRLTTDVAEFKSTFKQLVTLGLKSVTQTLGSAVHLFQISSSLTFTMLGTMPILYILLNVYGAYLRQLSKHNKILDGISTGIAGEVISSMRTVRAFASEEREMEHYGDACHQLSKANQYMGFHIGLFQGLTNISIGCMILTVLYYGGSLVVRNELSSGDLMSYMLSTQTAQQSLVSLGVLFGQTIKAHASASRVFEFIHQYPNVPLHGGSILLNVNGDVQFENIHFSYPGRPDHQVLNDFNLTIPSGTTVALCGHSGSGKSTIGSLLERFYEPTSGHIYLDGHNLSTLDPSWLRHHIGYINQEPILFATSILENIRYGRPDATVEEVREAARQANAEIFIETFPDGYDTVVGERGASLSGGQKQRIAIARALLKNPKILILDEATSALDTKSEKLVQDALDKLMQGRSVLVIAHRLNSIRKADLIVVMGRIQGNIVEKGTHDELMANKSVYYQFYNNLLSEEQF